MDCESCQKDALFLYMIGKSKVCAKCISRKTVFKDAGCDDTLLRKAMRKFKVNSFDELLCITKEQAESLV